MANAFKHVPVLRAEVVSYLRPKPGGIYVDCTVGGGGHSEAILNEVGGDCRLIGLDRDPEALDAAAAKLARFQANIVLRRENFRNIRRTLNELNIDYVDGILMDLGVSSHQLDEEERGFTYWGDGPLDMRLGPDAPTTAEALIASADQAELARMLRVYGEERWAGAIARAIVRERQRRPLKTAADLVDVIKSAVPAKARRSGPHPARRTFQALRIAVNDELGALEDGLKGAVERLRGGGRLVVISFHSLEDRIVKRRFAEEAKGCACPPDFPICRCSGEPRLRLLTKRPVAPSERERAANPRSRSAKLRAAERVLGERESE